MKEKSRTFSQSLAVWLCRVLTIDACVRPWVPSSTLRYLKKASMKEMEYDLSFNDTADS